MLDALERLLILQDRDRKIQDLQGELLSLEPQRRGTQAKATTARTSLEELRVLMRHLESDRKRLELEVEAKKELIERYSLQQFQTKRNEEYRTLAHEIELARQAIVKLEDEQLELMEQGEAAQRRAHAAQQLAEESGRLAERQLADLATREQNLKRELERLETERDQLAGEVDPAVLPRYERLRKSKGERVLVGIAHGVCGGCHVRLPAQVMITCQSSQEIVNCPNCGRILYYTRDMNLVAAE